MTTDKKLRALAFVLGALGAVPAAAEDVTQKTPLVVQQFTEGAGTGYYPNPIVGHQTSTDPGTWALYGTTQAGGTGQAGLFYSLAPPPAGSRQWTLTRLYLFGSVAADSTPVGRVVFDSAGAAYGILANTQTKMASAIYKLTPPSAGETVWQKTTIHTFTRTDQGAPLSLTIDPAGALYVTELDKHGLYAGSYGSIVKMTPPASGSAPWTVTLLHDFRIKGGEIPMVAPFLDPSGALYGATNTDASHTGKVTGHFYKLTPPVARGGSWTYSVLYEFLDPDKHNAFPQFLSQTPSGAIFGLEGSRFDEGESIVFQLRPPNAVNSVWTRTDMQRFDYLGGYFPAGLATVGETVYATFSRVSSGARAFYGGTVWRFAPPAGPVKNWTALTAARFLPETTMNGEVIQSPAGLLYSSTEDDYTGTAQYEIEHGKVFMIDPF